jgi:hypothetical protein
VSTSIIHSAEKWLALDLGTDESQIVVGTPDQPIIRAGTKNIIEAPEKSFKTTFMLRWALGISSGQTIFTPLPTSKKFKVLYLHGELAPLEIQERTRSASAGLPRPLDGLYEGRDITMHFRQKEGKEAIIAALNEVKPDVVVFDPWQGFISGMDENSFRDISEATHFVDELIQRFNVTVFLVTHLGKDRNRGTRGHSSLAGWRDTLIKLERDKRSNTVKVTVEPRWAAPPDPFHLKFDNGTLHETDHFTGQTEKIVGYLKSQGGTSTIQSAKTALEFKTEAGRKAIERAVKAGAIVRKDDSISLPDSRERGGQPHRVGVCPSGSCTPDKGLTQLQEVEKVALTM